MTYTTSEDKAKTLGHLSSVSIAPDRTIDLALLFQRFIVVSQKGVLSHALFEARHIFREPISPK